MEMRTRVSARDRLVYVGRRGQTLELKISVIFIELCYENRGGLNEKEL